MERFVLKNGELARPSIKDINWQIAIDNNIILQEKEMQLDQLTEQTHTEEEPYKHLQMLVINKDVKTWFFHYAQKTSMVKMHGGRARHDLMCMSLKDSKEAIDFSRHHLTHLDRVLFRPKRVQNELYVSFDLQVRPLVKQLNDEKKANRLDVNMNVYKGIPACTRMRDSKGTIRPVEIFVRSYDPLSQKFICITQHDQSCRLQMRSRLQIQLWEESLEYKKECQRNADNAKEETQQFLKVHNLIINEIAKRYTYIQLPDFLLKKIQEKSLVNLLDFDADIVRSLIIQIEASFVFAIFKSVLASQKKDPFIKGLLQDYGINPESLALKPFEPIWHEKQYLQGMESFNMRGAKVELDHTSIMLMSKKFIAIPKVLNSLTISILGKHNLFVEQFDPKILKINKAKEFRGVKVDELDTLVNTYPLNHHKFVAAQAVMSAAFHKVAKFQWVDGVANRISSYISSDFNFNQASELKMENIDVSLRRLLFMIKQYMQTVLFQTYQDALRDYTKFLLGFILRDQLIKTTAVIEELTLNPWIDLNVSRPQADSAVVNDLDLIRLKPKAMLKVSATIEDYVKPGHDLRKKQKIATHPRLATIAEDLFSVILTMHTSLHEIERVESLVFPLLEVRTKYLDVPDVQYNERLSHYVTVLEQLLEEAMKPTKLQLTQMKSFMPVFEKKVDGIVLSLKKQTFMHQQEMQMAEELLQQQAEQAALALEQAKTGVVSPEDATRTVDEESSQNSVGGAHEEMAEVEILNTEEREAAEAKKEAADYGSEDGEDETLGEEATSHHNDIAYRSVEIEEAILKAELFGLRATVWQLQEEVANQYDFGLVELDCREYKERVLDHCTRLIGKLEEHIRGEFLQKMRLITLEQDHVKGKLGMAADSFDDVIELLDYIETLKSDDSKIEGIQALIDNLNVQMLYTERLEVIFKEDHYLEFLHTRNWARSFRVYIEERKVELLSKKDSLFAAMKEDIEQIFEHIARFNETLLEVLDKGLVPADAQKEAQLLYGRKKTKKLTRGRTGTVAAGQANEPEPSASEKDVFGRAKLATPEHKWSGAIAFTFIWFAEEIGLQDWRFDINAVEEGCARITELKEQFDDVEATTTLIHKRQTLLGVELTEFSGFYKIQEDLKPLFELWEVARAFGRTVPTWIEGKFELIDPPFIEIKTDEWTTELKRLSKANMMSEFPKQRELQQFIIDVINQLKKYFPMMRTLRTRGLAARHWKVVSHNLGISLDPTKVTLHGLIMLGLHDLDKLRAIQEVCEVATKEHAVSQQLLALEREIKGVEFVFETLPESGATIVVQLPELISGFEDYALRLGVLATNPHIKNFLDKQLELERCVKSTLEQLNEWADLQRNFAYLAAIFALAEMRAQLEEEAAIFAVVKALVDGCTASFQENAQVYRITAKEGGLGALAKANTDCDRIRAGLRAFLEKKRGCFARLYFLSNEELIDIFGRGNGLVKAMMAGEGGCQAFVPTLFEGAHRLGFDPRTRAVTTLISKEGEIVPLARPVATATNVDAWLGALELAVVDTVKHFFFEAFRRQELQKTEEWLEEWPGQAALLSSEVWLCRHINAIFLAQTERERDSRGGAPTAAVSVGSLSEEEAELFVEADLLDDSASLTELSEAGDAAGREAEASPAEPEETQATGLADDLEEESYARRRTYDEALHRGIARDETANRARALLEKTLRLGARFRVNRERSAARSLADLQRKVAATILEFTEMVRKRLPNHVRQSTVALLTRHVHFRDILAVLLAERVQSREEFKWQIQFKFEVAGLLEAVAESGVDKAGKRIFATEKLAVTFEVFNETRKYGFEYLGNCPRLVVTPLTERCQRSLLIALQYHYGGAPEGPFGTGKTETTKDLGRQLARISFVMNCSTAHDYAGLCRFFKGLAAAGAWVCFDEFNRLDPRTLSLLAQVLITLQTALKQRAGCVVLDEAQVPLRADCAVFITLNPGYAGRVELPMNLKALFRQVCMVAADSRLITEILLYSAGFRGAQQLAAKIVSVQSLAKDLIKKPSVQFDFGLRSIKAIVGAAQALKLQAAAIEDCELSEIIDDGSLKRVSYQQEAIVSEMADKSQARIAQAITDKKKALVASGAENSLTGGVSHSVHGSLSISPIHPQAGSPTPARPGQTRTMTKESEPTQSVKDSKRGSANASQDKLPETERSERSNNSSNQTVEVAEEEDDSVLKPGCERGELFESVWREVPYKTRQRETIYKQIGIDPRQLSGEAELEEYVILKAVRDYNHSKFSFDEHVIIEGIVKDVFQNAVPDLDDPVPDYGALQECIRQCVDEKGYDFSESMNTKVLQFYEILRTKRGCMMVGDHQAGKSTLIDLLYSALNKAAANEFTLAVQDRRRIKMLELLVEYEAEQVQAALDDMTLDAPEEQKGASDFMGGAGKRKAKKSDKEQQAKKAHALYLELFRQTALSEEELDEIRGSLAIKGALLKRINPKAMTHAEMMGLFDPLANEYKEGLFTHEFRLCAEMPDDRRKWFHFDGPIDFDWVENLNSVLDDSARLNLPSGEQVPLSPGMALLLETNNMRNVTPATVSRCGLICLHRSESCKPKAIFNQWLRGLPPNLKESRAEIEAAANFLMVEALAVFEEEERSGKLVIKSLDTHWLMQNFVRMLTSMVYDYYLEYEKSNEVNLTLQASKQQEAGEARHTLTVKNTWVEESADPSATAWTAGASTAHLGGEAASQRGSAAGGDRERPTSQGRLDTPNARERLQKNKRLPRCNFMEDELRYENALKYMPIWLECFVLFSLVWTFGPALSEQGRKELDRRLQSKYEKGRTDYSQYQREKKRKAQESKKPARRSNAPGKRTAAELELAAKRSAFLAADGLTLCWTDDSPEKPMLISNYPVGASFYDYYFDLDACDWKRFDLEEETEAARRQFATLAASQRRIENLFVPDQETIRHAFVLECLVSRQVSTLVVGPASSGRSALLRNLLFDGVFEFSRKLMAEHVTLSARSDCVTLRQTLEALLEYRRGPSGRAALRPPMGNKLVCYVQDLHMAGYDAFGDQSAVEAMREYLETKTWLSLRKLRVRRVEDLSFFADLSSNSPTTNDVSGRALHHFNLLALGGWDHESFKLQAVSLAKLVVSGWGHSVQEDGERLAGALVDISERVFAHLRPTPLKSHYTFSRRDLSKILFSMQMVESNSMKTQRNVADLLYHECLRTYGDRLLMQHDREFFLQNLEEVCREHFSSGGLGATPTPQAQNMPLAGSFSKSFRFAEALREGAAEQGAWTLLKEPSEVYYSHWNQDVEGCYMEVESIESVQGVIEGCLERFNASSERPSLDLYLYNQLNRHMIKILRVLSTATGHLLNVAVKGFGMNTVVGLAAFAASHTLLTVETHEDYIAQGEWCSDLRQALMTCAISDKPVTLQLDEFKMLEDEWYTDLEGVLKNNMLSDVLRKQDLIQIITKISGEVEKEKRSAQLGLSVEDIRKEKLADYELEKAREARLPHEGAERERATHDRVLKHPEEWAEMYKVVLNRIKSNFHLVLHYSPTGRDFRQKICKHKELMYLSHMIFMGDLPECELEQLGSVYLDSRVAKQAEKLASQGSELAVSDQILLRDERAEANRILACAVGMYQSAQEAAAKYASVEKQQLHLTPVHFLRLFKYHESLLSLKKDDLSGQIEKYAVGLEKLKQTQEDIHDYHTGLNERGPQLQARLAQIQLEVAEDEERFKRVQGSRDELKQSRHEVGAQTDVARGIKFTCEETYNRIAPAQNRAINSVEEIEKQDLAQLRSMNKPPKSIKIALKILCIFLGVPPEETRSKKTGKPKLSYWRAAQGKSVLGDVRLPKAMQEFDRNKITTETMLRVEEEILHPEFSYEKAYSASRAATGIFKWIQYTRDYYYISREAEPRRDAFLAAERQFTEKFELRESSTLKIEELDTALLGLKEQQRTKDQVILELLAEVKDCLLRKGRADELIKRISAEKHKWVVCVRLLEQKRSALSGDIVLAAGYITLLSALPQRYRQKCLKEWAKLLYEQGFVADKDFGLSGLFGDAATLSSWHAVGLPTDQMSVNNAIVCERAERFCLLLDSEYQGITWLKGKLLGQGGTGARLVKQEGGQLVKPAEMALAIELGETVIVDEVTENLGLGLQSIMRKQVSQQGGQNTIQFGGKFCKYDRGFKLFVVCNQLRPQFGVDITNHITLVNFTINAESLTSQLLARVVRNERPELERAHSDNSREVFEAIASLKATQSALVLQLDRGAEELLGGEELIGTLDESARTAEQVAGKLRQITETSEELELARVTYLSVAQRAANFYFVLQALLKINSVYAYSLAWFREVFESSVAMTNAARSEPQSHQKQNDHSSASAEAREAEPNKGLSTQDRIDLLIQTITHEAYKRIQYAIYAPDKVLVRCLIATEILRAENCIEPSLFNFVIAGPRQLQTATRLPWEGEVSQAGRQVLPWVDKAMWAELTELANLKPFSKGNLLDHIRTHTAEWTALKTEATRNLSFRDLPNGAMLSFAYFRDADAQQLAKLYKQAARGAQGRDYEGRPPSSRPGVAGGKHSDGAQPEPKTLVRGEQAKHTESQILNDPAIWEVTDSDESTGSLTVEEVAYEKAPGVEEAMARYLVEKAPQLPTAFKVEKPAGQVRLENLHTGRKREQACQLLSELCLFRCVRPDQMKPTMERLVALVLNPYYSDFKTDLLEPLLRRRKVALAADGDSATGAAGRRGRSTSRAAPAKDASAVPKQLTLSTPESGGATPAAPSLRSNGESSQQEPADVPRPARAPPGKTGAPGGLKEILAAAFADSTARRPIMLLLKDSLDIQLLISDFQKQSGNFHSKLVYWPLYRGREEATRTAVLLAAEKGDWLILDNIQLVPQWVAELGALVEEWQPKPPFKDALPHGLNSAFRLWIACAPAQVFPLRLLQSAVKVAIGQPQTLKEQIASMIVAKRFEEKDVFVKKSGSNSRLHKNLFWGLMYFHAIVTNRKDFGVAGWNAPYQFQTSDFDISCAQLSGMFGKVLGKEQEVQLKATVETLRYYYAQVNYGGRIEAAEDQAIVDAVLSDVLSERIANVERLEANMSQSHFGFPSEEAYGNAQYCRQHLPDSDPVEVFGLTWSTRNHLDQSLVKSTFAQLGRFSIAPGSDSAELMTAKTSLGVSAARMCLQAPTDTAELVKQQIEGENTMVSLFIRMQQLLAESSLDHQMANDTGRYDIVTNSADAIERDKIDKEVARISKKLVEVIDESLPYDDILERVPVSYLEPLNNIINQEISCFKALLRTIKSSVTTLVATLHGQYPKPYEVEDIWNNVQLNKVPQKWLEVCYITSRTELAFFLVDLNQKLDFWRGVLEQENLLDTIQWWLPAFFNPKAFLRVFSQHRSRNEEIPLDALARQYDVQSFMEADSPSSDPESVYIYGLWLEGGKWDNVQKLLMDVHHFEARYTQFPVVKLSAPLKTVQRKQRRDTVLAAIGSTVRKLLDSPGASTKFGGISSPQKIPQGLSKRGLSLSKLNSAVKMGDNRTYSCPLFITDLRQSKRQNNQPQEAAPVEYFNLRTREKGSKWIKRGVALILEPEYT